MSYASAVVFIAMLYFAFTYNVWDWWVVAVLVLSFAGVKMYDWVSIKRTNETHYHYGEKKA